ncbi:hypothetical protein BT69DRAFT_1087363 [Atractiella rhizophila]|nr:hypothetical protein BT69DRAFT_1087363 [Atractiella rhizophila]
MHRVTLPPLSSIIKDCDLPSEFSKKDNDTNRSPNYVRRSTRPAKQVGSYVVDIPSQTPTPTPDPSPSITPSNPASVAAATKKTTRKVSRKVSHSLIERRRREKINDCLDTLKNIVPQCQEQMSNKMAAKQQKLEMAKKCKRRKKKDEAQNEELLEEEEDGTGAGLHKLEILRQCLTFKSSNQL